MSQSYFNLSSAKETDRPGRRTIAYILPIVLAAVCLWMARPNAAGPRGAGLQPAHSAAAAAALATPDAIHVSLPAASPKLITRPIEDITPGMRVLASNPELRETLPDSDVTPEDWRLVSLTMTKENGGTLNVQLLRPLEWFLTETVVLLGTSDDPQSLYQSPVHVTAEKDTTDYKLQQLLLGQRIYLDLPELGAQGLAKVTAIDPCPALDAAESGRRLVTGTFRHAAANVIDVQVGGETEPFGCTDNHPFWSVDREQFVEAGQLQIGENLQSADGTIVQVTRITPRRGPPVEVYNFEVDTEHVYHVGTSGVLVHNSCVYAEKINGIITYIGRSNNLTRRTAEWERAGRLVTGIADDLTPARARALEHLLIEKFARIQDRAGNQLGGTLTNLIGGIQPSKLQNFTDELEWARNFLANM